MAAINLSYDETAMLSWFILTHWPIARMRVPNSILSKNENLYVLAHAPEDLVLELVLSWGESQGATLRWAVQDDKRVLFMLKWHQEPSLPAWQIAQLGREAYMSCKRKAEEYYQPTTARVYRPSPTPTPVLKVFGRDPDRRPHIKKTISCLSTAAVTDQFRHAVLALDGLGVACTPS